MTKPYNYAHFETVNDASFQAFYTHLRVGDRAPDGMLTWLGRNQRVALSELWQGRPLVLEFGSIT